MTNPGNAIGTNAAYSGRTSVNAFNDILSALSRGVVSGWECKPSSGLTVELGGSGSVRDVAIAEDNAGNKTSINNISGSPVQVTLSAAPGANSRIDAIVAYVDSPTNGSADKADNPDVCGIIPVSGTVASSPSDPSDLQIRAAITSDGANGTSAYYVVLATVKMTANLSNITNNEITSKPSYLVGKKVTSDNVDFKTMIVEAPKSSVSSVGVGVEGIIQSLTIPETGRWKVEAIIAGYSDARDSYAAEQRLKKNGVAFMAHNNNYTATSGQYMRLGTALIGTVDADKGDKVDSTIQVADHSIQHIEPDRCCMVATRIG